MTTRTTRQGFAPSAKTVSRSLFAGIVLTMSLSSGLALAAEPARPAPVAARRRDLAETPPHPGTAGPIPTDLAAPELLLNRELTYLNFCWRVLREAEDARVPLLERLKFVAIVSANIDEFFQKRIGGLKQQVGAGFSAVTPDGRSPTQQIAECLQMIQELEARKAEVLEALRAALAEAGVTIVRWKQLDANDRARMRAFYLDNIFPLVTPQAMDPAHPFPFVSNLSLNLLVTLHYRGDGEPLLARVKVPIGAGIPRFLRIDATRFVPLDEVMIGNLDLLFPDMEIENCARFRVTRNAITEREEGEADDLLELIEIELRERRFAPIVRLQVESKMTPYLRGKLAAELGLDEQRDVFEAAGMLGQRDLIERRLPQPLFVVELPAPAGPALAVALHENLGPRRRAAQRQLARLVPAPRVHPGLVVVRKLLQEIGDLLAIVPALDRPALARLGPFTVAAAARGPLLALIAGALLVIAALALALTVVLARRNERG